jgi:hypothetical protein
MSAPPRTGSGPRTTTPSRHRPHAAACVVFLLRDSRGDSPIFADHRCAAVPGTSGQSPTCSFADRNRGGCRDRRAGKRIATAGSEWLLMDVGGCDIIKRQLRAGPGAWWIRVATGGSARPSPSPGSNAQAFTRRGGRGQVHVFGQGRYAGTRQTAEKWTRPRPPRERLRQRGLVRSQADGGARQENCKVEAEGDRPVFSAGGSQRIGPPWSEKRASPRTLQFSCGARKRKSQKS